MHPQGWHSPHFVFPGRVDGLSGRETNEYSFLLAWDSVPRHLLSRHGHLRGVPAFLFPRRNDMGILEKPVLLLSDFSTTDIEKE